MHQDFLQVLMLLYSCIIVAEKVSVWLQMLSVPWVSAAERHVVTEAGSFVSKLNVAKEESACA